MGDLLGVRWMALGRDPKTGLDCNGLVILFFERLGEKIIDPMDHHVESEEDFVVVEDETKFADVYGIDTKKTGYVNHKAISIGLGLVIHVHRENGVEIIPEHDLEGSILFTYRLKKQCSKSSKK